MRMLMRSIGYSGSDARIESYLMFEPGYVGSLIDLGYADTLADAAAIEAFLKD
jgi:NTE family protein